MIHWQNGGFHTIIEEVRTIQSRLYSNRGKAVTDSLSKRFADLMFKGKVNPALRLLSNEGSKGILTLSEDTLNILKEKDPPAGYIHSEVLLEGPIKKVNDAVFNNLDGDLIRKAAVRTK